MGAACGKVEDDERQVHSGMGLNKRDFVRIKETDVKNDYKIGEEIGKDKFAVIYKCKNKETKQNFVAKIYSVASVEPKILEAFIKEANLLREADHPNIIKVVDIYKDSVKAVIITEHCKGKELLERINSEGNLTENKIASYMKQAISAVAYIHSKKIIHRDLRPSVFSFLNSDPDSALKLTEFGSCKHFEKNLRVLERVGTPYFMAPEVIIGNYNNKCDIWSLGVLLYVLFSGTPPFTGDTESEIMNSVLTSELAFNGKKWKKISQEAKEMIQKMLNRNSVERPTAKQLLAHAWIKQRATDSVNDNKIMSSALENLSQFENQSKLQRATLAFIVSQIMSSDDVSGLAKVFKSIDKNGDGLLSRREIRKALEANTMYSEEVINQLIEKVDLDGNDKVNYSEFLAATVNWESEMSRERLEIAFKTLDQDHSGKISKEELMAAFGGSHQSHKTFEKMIQEADVNGDGEIDLEEFCTYMGNLKKNKSQ